MGAPSETQVREYLRAHPVAGLGSWVARRQPEEPSTCRTDSSAQGAMPPLG